MPNINPNYSKKEEPSLDATLLLQAILDGNRTALSRCITLTESTLDVHQETAQHVLSNALPHTGNSIRIGITGVPGVGKSTFIEAFGNYLIDQGHPVTVLAIDPSSSVSKGSILGDKTRMETLVNRPEAFIRPSPAGATLGGVTQKTREAIILCEAAGFDVILVETVGVGQSETAVHAITDFFLLLKLAGAGDELQGIKRGIIEMADAIFINKADGDNLQNAKRAALQFQKALHFYPPKENNWTPKTLTGSALNTIGIDAVWNMITEFQEKTTASGMLEKKRNDQNLSWFQDTVQEEVLKNFFEDDRVNKLVSRFRQSVQNKELTAHQAARGLFAALAN